MTVKQLITALLEVPDQNMIVTVRSDSKYTYNFHIARVEADDAANTGICTIHESTQILTEDQVGYPPLRHKNYTEQEKNELRDHPSDHYFAS